MSSFTDLAPLGQPNRITKTRGSKAAMKPILKRVSHSEKNSLDLDRGWEDAIHYGNHGWGAGGRGSSLKAADGFAGRMGGGAGVGLQERGKDVSFSLSAADLNGSPGGAVGYGMKYAHARSTSGTSVATSGSGPGARSGFIHPFQQTPRSSTPPLYANSLASFEHPAHPRDYSPTITEGEDDDAEGAQLRGYYTAPYAQPPSPRRPSLESQRTSSQSDLKDPKGGLRLNTVRANTLPPLPPASGSDLRLDTLPSDHSPTTTVPSRSFSPHLTTSLTSPHISNLTTSPTAPPTPPLRSSREMYIRRRSRAGVDTRARQAHIREARRQFEDKEAQKQAQRDEKAARKRDAAMEREAARLVKMQRRGARERNSGSLDVRPSFARGDTGETSVLEEGRASGLGGFGASCYEDAEVGARPDTAGMEEEEFGKKVSTRRRTASVWTSFILWVRTKLLKAGRR